MLALWMFGTELERTWGTRFFTKYYFVTGIGAALLTIALEPEPAALCGQHLLQRQRSARPAPSTACCSRYAMYFPHRAVYMYFVFPVPARYFVMIVGAITFLSSIGAGGTRRGAHRASWRTVVGYVYLKGLRARPCGS